MDPVEEIKQRLSVEDVIAEYVQLKRAGRNFKGLSPFTNEKTPSLIVSPEKQIWHDFSSAKGGDMFSFLMEAEGLDFKGALELLSRKAGVDLEKYQNSSSNKGPDKTRLLAANEAAAHFYQVQISKNKLALTYILAKRRFAKETALTWRLGYSPNTGTALTEFLKAKGFSEQELKQAGLSTPNYRQGLRDMFQGRLMIPLMDVQGQVVGFTARLLVDSKDSPKYINTPATVLYDKSRHVYGLNLAKETIRKLGFSVLAEGNLDVISSHQAGVRQTVATAGTALTEQQLKTLGRFAPDIRLSFDNDRAGLAAAERAIPIASKVGVSLSIINIPSGKDPDELIQQDVHLWEIAVSQPAYALDWLMDRYEKLLDIKSAEGKRKFSDILIPVIDALMDPVEKDHYLTLVAKKIDVSREALDQKMASKKGQRKILKPLKRPEKVEVTSTENIKAQDHLLAIVHSNTALKPFLDLIEAEMLYTDTARDYFRILKSSSKLKLQKVQTLADYDKILTLEFEELYQGLELNELRYEAARLQARLVEQYVKNEKTKLSAKLESDNESIRNSAFDKDKDLNALLKKVQGGANVQI